LPFGKPCVSILCSRRVGCMGGVLSIVTYNLTQTIYI
jgi:hypothetical protein